MSEKEFIIPQPPKKEFFPLWFGPWMRTKDNVYETRASVIHHLESGKYIPCLEIAKSDLPNTNKKAEFKALDTYEEAVDFIKNNQLDWKNSYEKSRQKK